MNERAELFRALAVCGEKPQDGLERVAEALRLPSPPSVVEHTEVFTFQLYPYASVYTGNEGMVGGESADRVAGFWRAIGASPPPEPDHLSALLGLYAALLEAETDEDRPAYREMRRTARGAFLWEHLVSWVHLFAAKLEDVGGPFYAAWGRLLLSALLEEAAGVGTPPSLPLHLRAAASLPEEGEARDVLRAVLAPARSGIVITRADLAAAARSQGLGVRMGERRFILEAMLGQDAAGTLGWLASEASLWQERHLQHLDVLGPVARHWAERAAAAHAFFVGSSEALGEVMGSGARA